MATVLLTLKGAKPGGLSRSPLFGAHPMGAIVVYIYWRYHTDYGVLNSEKEWIHQLIVAGKDKECATDCSFIKHVLWAQSCKAVAHTFGTFSGVC
eukprot:sb/3479235/